MSEAIEIYEVGPRDGLQNESRLIPTPDKVRLVNLLSACGFGRIEVASFVSPQRVPQMADGEAVMKAIERRAGVRYTALAPNLPGYRRARNAQADEVAVLVAASEGFSQANLNCSIAESLQRAADVASAAQRDGVRVRGYISCAVICPYDGPTPPQIVTGLAEQLLRLGCDEVSLGDTVGHGTPQTVGAMLDCVIEKVPVERIAGHYHDTGGSALANIKVSIEKGVRTFDASAGGLGGCPFAPGAKGNVDTRSVVALANATGFATGIDADRLQLAAHFALGLKGEHD